MQTIFRGLGAAALALALGGCWPMPGQNPDRTGSNPFETAITPETVAGLTLQWQAEVGSTSEDVTPVVSSAGVHIGGDCALTTLDPTTGATRWTVPMTDPGLYCATTQPVVVDTPEGSRIVSGAITWTSPKGPDTAAWLFDAAGRRLTPIGFGVAQTVRGTEVVFVHGSTRESNPATTVVIDEAGPTPRRLRSLVVDLDGTPGVTVAGGMVFEAGSGPMTTEPGGDGSRGQAVRAYSATDPSPGCHVNWLPDLGLVRDVECPLWLTPTDGQPSAPVIGAGGATLYVGTDAGTLYALDADTGDVRWTASLGSAASTPALAGGRLYVQTADGALYALPAGGCGAPTCAPTWEAPAGGGTTQPAVAGGVVVTTSSEGLVQAFDAAGCGAPTCPSLWEADSGIGGLSAPAVSGGQVYAAGEGTLVAYGLG